ncbi:MAG: hypothetical protein FJW39_14960 [Acidobacteria bacterium]|nr:hypothetical protein [Acidobacteriota bacterium]
MARLSSFEPYLFGRLRERVSGEAARDTLTAIQEAQQNAQTLSIGQLADLVGCDERNVRLHLNAIETAIDQMASDRLPVRFAYEKRGPGKQVQIEYRAILNEQWGHCEKLLIGFTPFGPTPVHEIDLRTLRLASHPKHYAAGAADLASTVASLLQEKGVRVYRHHDIGRPWLNQRPTILIGDTSAMAGFKRPSWAMPLKAGDEPPAHTVEILRYADVLVTRFLNASSPQRPVVLVEFNDEFAPLGLVCLLTRNEAMQIVLNQLALPDSMLPPDEYQLRIRFELDAELDELNNLGDPQVIRPFHFDLPPEEPVIVPPPKRGPKPPPKRALKSVV